MCHDHDVPVSVVLLYSSVEHFLRFMSHCVLDTTHDGCLDSCYPTSFSFFSVPAITKVHGAHLKASAAMVRLRLYDILALLPPKTYEGNANAHVSRTFPARGRTLWMAF